MTDYVEKTSELRWMRKRLPRGGQRELARRLGTYPDRISNAFAGLVRDGEFLGRLVAETRKLIEENAAEALSKS